MRDLIPKPKKSLTLLAAMVVAAVLLTGCGAADGAKTAGGGALTLGLWNGYDSFLQLVAETYPDIELDLVGYYGANGTGYSWAKMRGDDIPDIFITTQILDPALAQERLVDLSGYPFVSSFSNSVLDQVAIDGGVYLLPVTYVTYGIYYNKTLLEEHNWQVPTNFAELAALCRKIRAEGMIPGVIGTQLTDGPFSTVFNLAKTGWLTTPEGISWERAFLAGEATAAGRWEPTMEYVQRYIDIGMFETDPEDRHNSELILDYLGNRKAVFATAVIQLNITELPESGDKLGLMPYISEDGGKNVYTYSPSSYIGVSSRLLEPGNEQKLADAVAILSLLYSPEGQATFITEKTPCVMSVLNSEALPEDSLIYDAQRSLWQGRAFPMTYTNWENILAEVGLAYKEWFRGEGMDGASCIARMDELQQAMLNDSGRVYFCESTADFSMAETAKLIGCALGDAVGADAVLVPYYQDYTGASLRSGISGRLYAGKINNDVLTTVCPGADGEYALAQTTGAEAKALAQAGYAPDPAAEAFPYLLVTKGDAELADDAEYQVAFLGGGYTAEVGETYGAQVEKGSLQSVLRAYLTRLRQVTPGETVWR